MFTLLKSGLIKNMKILLSYQLGFSFYIWKVLELGFFYFFSFGHVYIRDVITDFLYISALKLLNAATTKLKNVVHEHSIDLANIYDKEASLHASLGN